MDGGGGGRGNSGGVGNIKRAESGSGPRGGGRLGVGRAGPEDGSGFPALCCCSGRPAVSHGRESVVVVVLLPVIARFRSSPLALIRPEATLTRTLLPAAAAAAAAVPGIAPLPQARACGTSEVAAGDPVPPPGLPATHHAGPLLPPPPPPPRRDDQLVSLLSLRLLLREDTELPALSIGHRNAEAGG